jgi:hypothetical protein
MLISFRHLRNYLLDSTYEESAMPERSSLCGMTETTTRFLLLRPSLGRRGWSLGTSTRIQSGCPVPVFARGHSAD